MAKRLEEDVAAYTCSGSTTWELRKVKIAPAPKARWKSASKRRLLSVWPRRDPLSLSIRSIGGSESWWWIKARGYDWKFPGHMALEDVMQRIHNYHP